MVMGYLFAERAFPEQEVGIFVHGNTENVHCHILVHSVSIEDGRKLQLKKGALGDLKQSADEKYAKNTESGLERKNRPNTSM